MVAIKQGITPVCYGNKMKTPGKKQWIKHGIARFPEQPLALKHPKRIEAFGAFLLQRGRLHKSHFLAEGCKEMFKPKRQRFKIDE